MVAAPCIGVENWVCSSVLLTSSIPRFSWSRKNQFRNAHLSRLLGISLSGIHSHGQIPTLSRRVFLPSVSGIWDALTGGGSAREAVVAVRRGMLVFRQGDVIGSLVDFDKAIEFDPRQRAFLWQRGLSLYYVDRFEEGAEQFRLDVAQNPNDTEESICCFLWEAQLYGIDEARKRFHEVGVDPWPAMWDAYNMFTDGGDPEQLVSAFANRFENENFYAHLYSGLYSYLVLMTEQA